MCVNYTRKKFTTFYVFWWMLNSCLNRKKCPRTVKFIDSENEEKIKLIDFDLHSCQSEKENLFFLKNFASVLTKILNLVKGDFVSWERLSIDKSKLYNIHQQTSAKDCIKKNLNRIYLFFIPSKYVYSCFYLRRVRSIYSS